MSRPDRCVNSENFITGTLLCSVCWRYRAARSRCPEFKERGIRLIAKPGKKPFGVRYEVKA